MKYCENCKKEHDGSFGIGKYCSRECSNNKRYSKEVHNKISKALLGKSTLINGIAPNKKPRVLITAKCIVCDKNFSIEIADTESGRKNIRKTCSEKCAYNFKSIQGRNSAKVQSESRRSKNESLFAEKCKERYKNVLTNCNMFNGWDADVVLIDQRVAILWNGKWHYEKLTKQHSVEQVQNRDRIKIQQILNNGFIPYVIKDLGSFNEKFVEEKFRELVNWLSQVPHKD